MHQNDVITRLKQYPEKIGWRALESAYFGLIQEKN